MPFDPSQPFEIETAGAQPAPTPITHYSQGKSVGGPDEMEDHWTNQGYTATGKNLTTGVVAVNPDVYPLGTVLQDADTGEAFLAADRHGNKDPKTVDIYQPPDRYTKASGTRRFVVAGKLDKVPDSADGVRAALAQFGQGQPDNREIPGLISPGNIDLNNRPVVKNADGTISTVRSITIGTKKGAVLIPTVVGNQVVSNEAAVKHFEETGENLGAFQDEASANKYAEQLHESQATLYGGKEVSQFNDPSQSGFFEYADADGTRVRRPAMAVREETSLPPTVPVATGFDPSQPFEVENSDAGFDPSQPFETEPTPSFFGNLWNSFAKGASSEGIYSGTEGAARSLGTTLQSPEEEIIARQTDGSYKLDWWKALLNGVGETLVGYADDTASLRNDLRAALPVDEEFADSYIGGIAQGAGQLAGQLPQFAIPGMSAVTALGTAYDQQYQDALTHGASPEQAHNAGLVGMPSGTLDYLADKFILGKILKPLRGKITVGDVVKHVALATAAEGATEGTQQVWQNIVAKQLSGYDPERPLDDEVLKSIIIGGVVGGGAVAVGSAATAVAAPRTPATGRLENVKVEAPSPDAAAMAEAFGTTPAPVEAPAVVASDSMMDRNAGWKRTTPVAPPPVETIAPAAEAAPVQAPAETGAPRWKASDYEAANLAKQYREEMESELATTGADTGYELLAAIDRAGGLPSKDSPRRAAWSGELDRVLSAARSKVDPKGGAFVGTLFRRNAPDLDQLRGDLADHGFNFETENDLIDALETRLSTGKRVYGNPAAVSIDSNIPFSKAPATPEHVQAIAGRVDQAVQRVFGNGRGPRPEVVVHAEPGAIPDNALRSAVVNEESKGKGVVDAFLNPADGKIHLIANRLKPDQVEAKIRHEGLHWALRTNEKFRADYEAMMGNFAETLPADTLRDLRGLYGDDPAKLMEEYMARLAEAEPNSTAWRTFVVKVKALLARYFPGVKFSEADIRAFLNSGMQRRASMEAKPGPIATSKVTHPQGWGSIDNSSDSGLTNEGSPQRLTKFSPVPKNEIDPTDAQRIDAFEQSVNRRSQNSPAMGEHSQIRLTLVRPDGLADERTAAALGFARDFGKLTGTRVLFVESDQEHSFFSAAINPRDPNTIFIHARAPRPLAALVGHEWGHTLQHQDPALYRDLQRVVAKYTNDWKARTKGINPALYHTVKSRGVEWANNSLGDAFLDPEFWTAVKADQNTSLFQKAYDSAMRWLNNLVDKASSAWGTGQSSTNLRAMRDEMARVVSEAIRRGPYENGKPTGDAELAFSKTEAEEAAASVDPQAKRKFTESVKRNADVRPEVKQRLKAEFYDPVSNPETIRLARAGIQAKGLDASMADILKQDAATWKPEATDYATALEVAAELHKRGRLDDEAAIYDKMAVASTDQGRAIQFLSMMGRYSPEGIQIFAARQIGAAVEADPELKRLYGEISRLRDELAEARKPAATQAVLDIQKYLAEVLKDKSAIVRANLALRDALMQTWTDPAAAVATFKRLLEAVGVSTHNADRIAKRLANTARERSKKNREEVLKKIKTAGERRFPEGAVERMLRLNREGKLDDAAMHAELSKLAGVPVWTPEMAARAKRLAGEYERASDPEVKLVLAARMLDTVRGMTPPSVWAKADGLKNLAMLLSPKTIIRNFGGNQMLWAVNVPADAVTLAADKVSGAWTGTRTRASMDIRARLSGITQPKRDYWNGYQHARSEGRAPWESFADALQHMIDISRLTSAGKFEISKIDMGLRRTFSAPVLRHLENTLTLLLGVGDRIYFSAALQSSIDRQMNASKASGKPVLTPTNEIMAEALADAQAAIFQNDNVASKAGKMARDTINLPRKKGDKWVAAEYGLGSHILPFVKVPGSMLMKSVEFSPANIIRVFYEGPIRTLILRDQFRQKEFTEAIGRTATGAAIFAAGYWLAKLGILTALPDDDKDVAAMQKASGMGAFSFNASAFKRAFLSGDWWNHHKPEEGDVILNYAWLAPISVSLAAGAQVHQSLEQAKITDMRAQTPATVAKLLWSTTKASAGVFAEQSFLTGLGDYSKDVALNGFFDATGTAIVQMPLQFIPSIVRQYRDYSDNTKRETGGGEPLDRIASRAQESIPGLSEKLPKRFDIAGKAEERYQYASNTMLNVFFNPAFLTHYKADPELQEAERVYRATSERGVLPRRVESLMSVGGVTVRLTNEELAAYQESYGQMGQKVLANLLASPEWAAAPMPAKSAAMAAALRLAHNAAKLKTLGGQTQLLDRAKAGIQSDAARTTELMRQQ